MKIFWLILYLVLLLHIKCSYDAVKWIQNYNIDAGQIKHVILNTSAILPFSSYSYTYTYNNWNLTKFTSTPRVILNMIGYGQNAPNNPMTDYLGFQTNITGITLTSVTVKTVNLSPMIVLLHYLYFAVQLQTTTFHLQHYYLTFDNTYNVNNNAATSRFDTLKLPNPTGQLNSVYIGEDIVFYAYPIGFKSLANTGRIYFSVNASIFNSTHFTLNVSSIGDSLLLQLDFSIVSFNRGRLTQTYQIFIDVLESSVTGNASSQISLQTKTTIYDQSMFMFRNSLNSVYHIDFPIGLVAFYYTGSNTNNNQYLTRLVNHRIRSCKVAFPYYQVISNLCYDLCPSYFYPNNTYKYCLPCYYTCQQCTSPSIASTCSACNATENRILVGTNCLCNDGYYDDGVVTCKPCDYQCLTCTQGTNSSCKSCDPAKFRTLDSTNSICNCIGGYYENIDCFPCVVGCTSCSYTAAISAAICFNCDSSLFRVITNDSLNCLCLNGYYQAANKTCIKCPFGCLSCSLVGGVVVCSQCDSSLLRVLDATNSSCPCQIGYFELANTTCQKCKIGCLSCTFTTTQICDNCDTAVLLRVLDVTKTCVCQIGYYEHTNLTCIKCMKGCLSCLYSASVQYCTQCDTTDHRNITTNTSCNCITGYYQNLTNSTCTACMPYCLSCTYSTMQLCSQCDSSVNRMVANNNQSCECSLGYYEDLSLNCVVCPLGCTNCSFDTSINSVVCFSCDASKYFTLVLGTCVCGFSSVPVGNICTLTDVCGDGIISYFQKCDDNNIIDGDGCSRVCEIQQNHACDLNTTLLPYSICYYNRSIGFDTKLVYKYPGQNRVLVQFEIDAPNCNPKNLKSYLQNKPGLGLIDKKRRFLSDTPNRLMQSAFGWTFISTKSVSYDPSTQLLTILFQYSQTLTLSNKIILFVPSSDITSNYVKYFYNSPQASAQLGASYNHLEAIYLSPSDASSIKMLKYAFYVLIAVHWLFYFVALAFREGAIATESLLVFQISYISFIGQPIIQQAWAGIFLAGRFSSGFNPNLTASQPTNPLKVLQLDSNFINSVGVTLILVVVLSLIVLVYVIANYIQQRRALIQKMSSSDEQNLQGKPQQTVITYGRRHKALTYVLDITATFIILIAAFSTLTLSATNTKTLTINIIGLLLISICAGFYWVVYFKRVQNVIWKKISFVKILRKKLPMNRPLVDFMIKYYYLVMYFCLALLGLISGFAFQIGIAVYSLILVASIIWMIGIYKFSPYYHQIHNQRAILSIILIIFIIILHLVQTFRQQSTGLDLVIVGLIILVANLTINIGFWIKQQYSSVKQQAQNAAHEAEMKQMANNLKFSLAANLTGMEAAYTSIKKNSLDSTRQQIIINDELYNSIRDNLLDISMVAKSPQHTMQNKVQELRSWKIGLKRLDEPQKNLQQILNGAESSKSDDNPIDI